MNFVKNAAGKATKAIKDFIDSSDEDEVKQTKRKQKQKKDRDAAATKNDDDDDDKSSSSSSVDTEDLEEAGEIVADVFTGGIYGEVVDGIEAAELAKEAYDENQKNKVMKMLKGRRVFLVRHGNAGEAPKDEERRLTSKGESQCATFLSSFTSELGGVTYVFCSPATRTVETARLLGFSDAVVVPDLYFGPYQNDETRELESELGYAPVADYLRGKGEEIYDPVRTRMGYALGKAGMSEMERKREKEKDGDVLVVGHATYLSLLALEVLGAMKAKEEEETTTLEKTKNASKAAWETAKSLPKTALAEAEKELLGEESGEGEAVEAACEEEEKILSFNMGEVEGFEISAEGKVRLLKA